MPRYSGPSRKLIHRIELLLDDDGLRQVNACAEKDDVSRNEAIRRAIHLRFITICLSKSIDRTMHPTEQEAPHE